MNYIILSNILMLGMLTYINASLLKIRYKNKLLNFLIFLIGFVLISSINAQGASSFKAIVMLFIFVIYSIIIIESDIESILLTILPYYIIVAISEIFTSSILHLLTNFSQYTNPTSFEYFCAICISNLLSFTMATIYIQLRKKFDYVSLPNYTWVVFILPLTTIIFITNISNYYEIVNNTFSLFIILLGLLLSNFIYIFIFFRVIENVHIQKNVEILKYKDELTNIRYKLLDHHYKSNFKFLHDLLNDCRELNKYYEEKKYDKLKKKINSINTTAFNEFNAIYSNSPVLNSVINNYMTILNEEHINIKTTIEYSDFSFLSLYEQTELFSLLIDLGIKNCESVNSKGKTIFIKSKELGNQMILQMIVSSKEDCSHMITSDFNNFIFKNNIRYSSKFSTQNNTMNYILIFEKDETNLGKK